MQPSTLFALLLAATASARSVPTHRGKPHHRGLEEPTATPEATPLERRDPGFGASQDGPRSTTTIDITVTITRTVTVTPSLSTSTKASTATTSKTSSSSSISTHSSSSSLSRSSSTSTHSSSSSSAHSSSSSSAKPSSSSTHSSSSASSKPASTFTHSSSTSSSTRSSSSSTSSSARPSSTSSSSTAHSTSTSSRSSSSSSSTSSSSSRSTTTLSSTTHSTSSASSSSSSTVSSSSSRSSSSSTSTTSQSSSTSTTSTSSSAAATTGVIAHSANLWAMTYTPYTSAGLCKSAAQVATDIASIAAKGFKAVRLYATDCSALPNVGSAAAANGLKIIAAVYIDNTGIGSYTDNQVSTLVTWGNASNWANVEMVVFGNEAVLLGYTTASKLAGGVNATRSTLRAAGYTGPVTTTESLNIIEEYASTICPAVDVAAANIHPFFNPSINASQAGAFVVSQLADLKSACGGTKAAYNLETGWPSNGTANVDAVPGVQEQITAIKSIVASAGSNSAMFSFENDAWKQPGPFDVEQYWGCAQLFAG